MSSHSLALASATVLIAALSCSCSRGQTAQPTSGALDIAVHSITPESLAAHIERLSSDEFEGRAPGTQGERLTARYLSEQFKARGLKPGNPDGSYIQAVPLVGLTANASVRIVSGMTSLALRFPDDYIAVTRRIVPQVTVAESDVVFVGYGVVAPEYGWDDYKGMDVRGKTIVMLVNDPAVPAAADSSTLDERMFRGRAMTYYGRWTYKYEIAAQKGAAAAIIVHETGPAGYPWEVVSATWGRENFEIQNPDGNMNRIPVEAWIHLDRAKELFKAAGSDFDRLKQAALRKDFKPVFLPAKASFTVTNTVREIESQNVVAKIEGSDPQVRDEYVVYMAHWDHLGRNPSLQGDQIFNGALDNASGTAGLLEIARAYRNLNPAPRRSMVFLAVTAEEFGLLGAKYYAVTPLFPLERTLAALNIDGVNQWGRTRDIGVVGLGNSTLDDVLNQVSTAKGRTVSPDAEPEKGFFYRSDHFEFAKQGVPSLFTRPGIEYIGKSESYSRQKRDEYTARDYHKVSDEMKPDWDLSGAAEDLQFLVEVGYRVAQGDRYPEWKPGTEFRAKREEMLKSVRPDR